MSATKTQTTASAATAQAAPAPATPHRVEKERITLEFSDVHEAFEVLSVLCLHLEGLYEDLNHQGWKSARTANTLAIAAGALHYHANALTDAMIDRRNAQGGDDGDAHEVEAQELFLEMKRAAARPGSVEGLQAYANSQQAAAEYEFCHWLAAYVGALAAGTSPPARATYQAPPRTRPAQGAAAPMITSAETEKERGQ